MEQEVKKCVACLGVKPLDEFNAHNRSSDGRTSRCTKCVDEDIQHYLTVDEVKQVKEYLAKGYSDYRVQGRLNIPAGVVKSVRKGEYDHVLELHEQENPDAIESDTTEYPLQEENINAPIPNEREMNIIHATGAYVVKELQRLTIREQDFKHTLMANDNIISMLRENVDELQEANDDNIRTIEKLNETIMKLNSLLKKASERGFNIANLIDVDTRQLLNEMVGKIEVTIV
jgi:hypothetical protein